MKTFDLDHLIANLAKLLYTNKESFDGFVQQESDKLCVDDLVYLRKKLHSPPPVHADIDEHELKLGEWLAVCQFVIFELMYQLGVQSLNVVKSIAFGDYDWTQANALEVLCRLYLDGKLSEDIISEIDASLPAMRHETHLYFAQGLINRREQDSRFNQIIVLIKNIDFRLALAELGYHQFMTKEELIELGKKIVSADGSEEEIQKLMELFDQNVPRPNGSSLFYWPENYNFRTHEISEYNPTVEEVVDKCLSYKQ